MQRAALLLLIGCAGSGSSIPADSASGSACQPDDPTDPHPIVFVMPYQGDPAPASHDVEAPAKIARADVAILLDTSGSMLGTYSRIQPQFQMMVTMLAGQVDDLAFGAAGIGDFPVDDGANSQYDVPYYLVHRIMTARTAAGLASIVDTFQYKNIITDGLGPWFAGMRGGDDPEQGWEALRQAASGIGLTYPDAYGGTESVPAFSPAGSPPAGEETGTIGGLGFREHSLPIILVITDTTQHDTVLTTTTPHSADHNVAIAALAQIGARVIGVNAWLGTGDPDLQMIATATGAHVAPEAWGTGSDRPANCPVGHCCLVADDPSTGVTATQPLPVNGECTLSFWADRYDDNLARIMAQAVTATARGVRFSASATVIDDPSDAVDATQFVDHVDAIASGSCAGASAHGNTFDAVVPGTNVCFRITAKPNATVPATGKYRAFLQLAGDGVADLPAVEVWFIVTAADCSGGVIQ